MLHLTMSRQGVLKSNIIKLMAVGNMIKKSIRIGK